MAIFICRFCNWISLCWLHIKQHCFFCISFLVRGGHGSVPGCFTEGCVVSVSLRESAKNNLKISCLAEAHVKSVLITFKGMEYIYKKNIASYLAFFLIWQSVIFFNFTSPLSGPTPSTLPLYWGRRARLLGQSRPCLLKLMLVRMQRCSSGWVGRVLSLMLRKIL